MSEFFALLKPVLGVLLGAITAYLTKWFVNEFKAASTWLGNSTATVKQGTALTISSILAFVTSVVGAHFTGEMTIVVQALVGWLGSLNLYDSSVKNALKNVTADLIPGTLMSALPPQTVINIHPSGNVALNGTDASGPAKIAANISESAVALKNALGIQ